MRKVTTSAYFTNNEKKNVVTLAVSDLLLFIWAVMRYNNEEMRREIVRLEQGARSYMQRAIASNGAFAVLYGRYSKHYIRKAEVHIYCIFLPTAL